MHRNRGSIPDLNINEGYGPRLFRYRSIIIIYDYKFFAVQFLLDIFVILVVIASYIITYKTNFNDPIASTKNAFLTFQLVFILITTITSLSALWLARSKEFLIKILKIIGILSIFLLVLQFGCKLYLDNTYTESKFAEFYNTYEKEKNVGRENIASVKVDITGAKINTLEEDYIDKSVDAYNNFKIKTYIYIFLYAVVIALIFATVSRLSKIQDEKAQLSKDDAILFDEEENIKF